MGNTVKELDMANVVFVLHLDVGDFLITFLQYSPSVLTSRHISQDCAVFVRLIHF